jgi:hypothetical protein
MSAWRWSPGILAVIGALLTGCGGPSTPPATAKVPGTEQPAAPPAPKPTTPAVMPRTPELGPPLSPLAYEAKGRRDPFSPVPPAAVEKVGLDVGSLKLAGIIRGSGLLALVEAPDGLGYIVKPGDTLGNGRITDITPSSVTFAVAARAAQRETSVTLRLVKD